MSRGASHTYIFCAALGGLVSSCAMIYSDSDSLDMGSKHLSHGGAGSAAISAQHDPLETHTAAPPKITVTQLPEGDPGVSTPQVILTNEQPARGDGVGAFRTVCEFSHMNYDDPIVFPLQPGKAHLHTYFGNTSANANTTGTNIRSTGNSTCRGGTINRTGYWVPALIDAAGRPLEPDYMDVYYKSGYNGIAPNDIRPFPARLRMVAGDMRSTSAQRVAYWGCRDHYIGHVGSIPDCPAGDALAMIIEFPQCWDGKNIDSADHRSHVAYPQGGACPATHPVAIPAITLNVYYKVTNATHSGLRLASDMYDPAMPGGYSVHGDWFDGWDRLTVLTFVQNCIRKGLDCHSHLLGGGQAME